MTSSWYSVQVYDNATGQTLAGAQITNISVTPIQNGNVGTATSVGNETTDNNGQSNLFEMEDSNWIFTYEYEVSYVVSASGFATQKITDKTGSVTGGVSKTIQMSPSGGNPNGGGVPTPTGTPNPLNSSTLTTVIVIVVVVVILIVAIHYRKQIFGAAKSATKGVAKYARG